MGIFVVLLLITFVLYLFVRQLLRIRVEGKDVLYALINWSISILLIALTGVLLLPVHGCRQKYDYRNSTKVEISWIQNALISYRLEYGTFPPGDHLQIIQALEGNNPRKIVFLEFNPKQKGPQGQFSDRWGTPYRIDVSYPGGPRIHSPGKNKKDEVDDPRSDDVCS